MTYGLVIASYRYGHLAAHAIESALSQTERFDRIYFVDDGVGDCKHLPALYPSVEYIFREKNMGIVANFQDMLFQVETDYVMFLGADNWLRSDALDLIKSVMTGEESIVTYDICVTGELKEEIQRLYPDETEYENGDIYWQRTLKHHGSMLYNVQEAKRLGGYAHNGGIRSDEDMNLWQKFMKAGAGVAYVNHALLYYRRHKENFNKY